MFLAPLPQAQTGRAQSELALRQLEQELISATNRNDWHFWDQVVAPEWTFIDHFGRQWDKPAVLEGLKSVKIAGQKVRLYDVQVHFFKDDVAMVTGTITITIPVSGKTVTSTTRSSDILVYRQGKWVVVASQATLVKQSS